MDEGGERDEGENQHTSFEVYSVVAEGGGEWPMVGRPRYKHNLAEQANVSANVV